MSTLAFVVLMGGAAALAIEPAPAEPEAAAEAPPPDPTTVPITVAKTAATPGPFTIEVDPYVAAKKGQDATIEVVLFAPEGSRLYRDMVAVTVGEDSPMKAGALVLPKGEPYEDPWGGGPREIFTGEVEVVLPLSTTGLKRGRYDVELVVSWQGCSDSMCFMPGTQVFNVPVRVKAP